jgi:alpha-beta hydrolase superfamily lysophospholipase
MQATGELTMREASLDAAGRRLFWRAVEPERSPRARVALLHGYGDHSGRYQHFMRWLGERGVASAALDFRGHGLSAGRRGHCSRWEEFVDDLRAFVDTLAETSAAPLFILAHSHGGLVAAAAGEEGLEGVRGCIFSAPFFHGKLRVPAYKTVGARLLNPILPWMPIPNGLRSDMMSADGEMVAESTHDPLVVRTATPRWYLTCLRAQERVLARADRFKLPLLMLVPEQDSVADPDAMLRFYEAASPPDKELKRYPGFRHELLRESERERVFHDVLRWIEAREEMRP